MTPTKSLTIPWSQMVGHWSNAMEPAYSNHSALVLAANLLAALESSPARTPPHTYRPRPRSLYLIATGPRHAIASWGRWSAEGRWVWRWKDYLDRGFIARHQHEAIAPV